MINEGNTADAKSGGLLGVIRGLTITPQFDAGIYDEFKATIYPKLIEVSFDFGVLHQHKVGYDANNRGTWLGPQQFPYGVGGTQTSETAKTITRGWATGEATAGAENADPLEAGGDHGAISAEQNQTLDADSGAEVDKQGTGLGQVEASEPDYSDPNSYLGNVREYFMNNPEETVAYAHQLGDANFVADFEYDRDDWTDYGGSIGLVYEPGTN